MIAEKLAKYALSKGLIIAADFIYTKNRILEALCLSEDLPTTAETAEELLEAAFKSAVSNGISGDSETEKDLFFAKIAGAFTPPPSEVASRFWQFYGENPIKATDWFYEFCGDIDYIKKNRIEKDVKWRAETPSTDFEMTINLSKPEKDPKAIAAAKTAAANYPKCSICFENEGFAGNLAQAPRQNLRIIPISLCGDSWGLQFSPYVYYNEHCIVINSRHLPMKIDESTFIKLLSFLDIFPHYFIGSNADLPYVGGSIMAHEHFQGGRHEFPMDGAKIISPVLLEGFKATDCGILDWPLSVLRLSGENKEELVAAASHIFEKWKNYSREEIGILAESEGERHNTITPIARKRGGKYELDLVLRNNRRTPERPLGIFHPRPELHHIKKENIGLIEVMGLAVLPGRLKKEFDEIIEAEKRGENLFENPLTAPHAEWAEAIAKKGALTKERLYAETGLCFEEVLKDCGVFKTVSDFENFTKLL